MAGIVLTPLCVSCSYYFMRNIPRWLPVMPTEAPMPPLTPLLSDDGDCMTSLHWLARRYKFSQPYFATTELRQFTFKVRGRVRVSAVPLCGCVCRSLPG